MGALQLCCQLLPLIAATCCLFLLPADPLTRLLELAMQWNDASWWGGKVPMKLCFLLKNKCEKLSSPGGDSCARC